MTTKVKDRLSDIDFLNDEDVCHITRGSSAGKVAMCGAKPNCTHSPVEQSEWKPDDDACPDCGRKLCPECVQRCRHEAGG